MRNIRSRNYPTILTKIENINKKEVDFSEMNQIWLLSEKITTASNKILKFSKNTKKTFKFFQPKTKNIYLLYRKEIRQETSLE